MFGDGSPWCEAIPSGRHIKVSVCPGVCGSITNMINPSLGGRLALNKKDMAIFFHIPGANKIPPKTIADQLVKIIRLVHNYVNRQKQYEISEEIIYIRESDTGPKVEHRINSGWKELLRLFESIQSPLAGHGSITLNTTGVKGKIAYVKYSYTTSRSKVYTEFMIKDECYLYLEVSKALFSLFDQEEFLRTIQEVQVLTKATYVCIDNIGATPVSIYFASLRKFGVENWNTNPEKKVPGIYWIQYLSEDMIPFNDFQNIVNSNELPFSYNIVKINNKPIGYWIRLKNDLSKFKIDELVSIRRILYKHTYDIDLEQIFKAYPGEDPKKIVDYLVYVCKVPLNQDEISRILQTDTTKYLYGNRFAQY